MTPSSRRFHRWARRWVYVLLIVLLAGGVLYHVARGPRRIAGGPAVLVAKLPAYARQTVTLDGQPRNMPEWLKELSKQARTPIEILDDEDASDFKGKSIQIEKPGTYTLAEALSIVLNSWSRPDMNNQLTSEYTEDRVTVGTAEAVYNSKRIEIRIYPIGDLLEERSAFITATTHIGRVAQLEQFIATYAHPDTWRESGGTIGTISDLGDRLVIGQTPGTHWEIQQLLDSLRKLP